MPCPRNTRRPIFVFGIAAVLVTAAACVSTTHERRTNVLEYLYPEGKAETPASVVELELPLTVGVAFVPESSHMGAAIRPGEKQALLERVQKAFAGSEDLDRIEVVPANFVTARGGFANVRQIQSSLGVDLIALVSFDQTQFDDPNLASITYWTIAGAYVVPGNENETHTLLHASVFDIESRAMLLNASGESMVKGRATAVNLERSLREDRVTGFDLAVDGLITNLDLALARFREQVKSGTVRGKGTPAVKLTSASSASGSGAAGALGWLGIALGLIAFSIAPPVRRRT